MTATSDRLRLAAARLRELDAAATPGPWIAWFTIHADPLVVTDETRPYQTVVATPSVAPADYGRANTALIAACRPLPALVADILDAVADEEWCCDDCKYAADISSPHIQRALAVADAILGKDHT